MSDRARESSSLNAEIRLLQEAVAGLPRATAAHVSQALRQGLHPVAELKASVGALPRSTQALSSQLEAMSPEVRKLAWHLAKPCAPTFLGLVEVDETYVGGKEGKKRKAKRRHLNGTAGKIPVLGALTRRGVVVTQVVETTDTRTLQGFVTARVSRQAELVATDEHSGYSYLRAAGYRHETVRHGRGEYVRGRVHTQSIESFWAVLKRGLLGTFHHVSRRYLPLYLSEFTFRQNHRTDPHRFERMLAGGIRG